MSRYSSVTSPANRAANVQQYMSKVYLWMMIGFCLSALVAHAVITDPVLTNTVLRNPTVFNILIVLQLAAVFGFVFIARRGNAMVNGVLFLVYSALTGATLSVVAFAYTQAAITQAFAITAGSFLALSIFGYVTKRDLGPIGSFCIMGLFGMIILMLVSFFVPALRSNTMQLTFGAIGVIVFSGLTAYDTQRIKQQYLMGGMQNENAMAITGALSLYLDFINLFLSVLRFTDR